ncbi:MAG: HNH endonuclease [bacterium]|nr:HNH endonuclease [bacterium]
MNLHPKNILRWILAVAVVAIFYNAYFETSGPEIYRNSQLASLLGGEEKSLNLNKRIKNIDCRARGPLPDSDCTPGAIFPNTTKDQICIKGYSKTVRNVPTSLKRLVFEEYGISYPQPFGSYEVDHLIPLSLGGNNDIENLWPKAAKPFPGFWEKNIVANYLREEVCDGRIALSIAQEQIANDWFSIYKILPDNLISELKEKYPNWANRRK